MIEWVREILFSKSAFIGYARAVLVGLGIAITTGNLGEVVPPSWGPFIAILGAFLRSTMPITPKDVKRARR